MQPQHLYQQQQQYQYLLPYHPTTRHSSSSLSSMMDPSSNNSNHHHHHHHNHHNHHNNNNINHHQQQQQQQSIPYPPQTPFDMSYGASMLPRQLLIGSPFVQTPINGSPSRPNFNMLVLRDVNSHYSSMISGSPTPMMNNNINNNNNGSQENNITRRGHNYMLRPPVMRSLSVSSSSTSLSEYYNNSTNNNNSSSNTHINSINENSNSTINGGRNSRSIIIQDLPLDITLNQFLNEVKIGPIENCHFVNEDSTTNSKKSIVLTFIDFKLARKFFQQVSNNHRLAISLNAPDLKISWSMSSPMLSFVQNAINNDSATRNVYIGNIKPRITKEILEEELQNYGIIDTVDFIEDRKIAFVHFTSIASAIKAVEQLPLDSNWSSCKIFYGKDRCSQQHGNNNNTSGNNNNNNTNNNNKNNNNNNNNNSNKKKMNDNALKQLSELGNSNNDFLNSTLSHNTKLANTLLSSAGTNNIGNRCLYLGNLHPQTTVEEICNVIRGGLLQSIKLMSERHICFITFIEPLAAVQFFANTSIDGLLVHGRKLKIGWGKHSGPLPNLIALLVTAGLSRNIYIGVVNENGDNNDEVIPDEETLRNDFSQYGDVEQINFFKDGKCGFVNFYNISSAIKCVEEFQKNDVDSTLLKFDGRYDSLKIAFGKDRCGNPPKLKKVKKSNNNNNNNNNNKNNSNHQIISNESKYEVSNENNSENALIFASMGITSKSLNVFNESEDDVKSISKSEQDEEDMELNNVPENSSLEALQEEEGEDDEDEDEDDDEDEEDVIADDDIDVIVNINDQQVEVKSLISESKTKIDENGITTSTTISQEIPLTNSTGAKGEEEVESVNVNDLMSQSLESLPIGYESSDADSVSIIGNNDTDLSPMTSKPSDIITSATVMVNNNNSNNNTTSAKIPYSMHKRNSATQFRSNNNSRSSSFSYDNNFPIYNNSNNYMNGQGFNSRQSSKSHLNKYYQQGQGQMNAFATSGSQIMAQYLAQSQHENLLYATHVLTDDQQQLHSTNGDEDDEDVVDDEFDVVEDDGSYCNAGHYYYDEFQPPHPHQQYAKMYPYPMQPYPYILATAPPPPPPGSAHQLQSMLLYGSPTSSIINGRGGGKNSVGRGGGSGGFNGRGGNNNNNNNNNQGRNNSWKNNNNNGYKKDTGTRKSYSAK